MSRRCERLTCSGRVRKAERGSRLCSYAVTMRVLVVEDEERMASLLRRALEEEGHAVDVARDGPEGVWLATENPYGAVVLDLMLPGFDGFEVCRRLRAAGVWAPVLMLTARDEIGDRVRGLDAGADDYLVKPFSLLELAARLRALARRDDRVRPVLLTAGDLKLDPAAKRGLEGRVGARPLTKGVLHLGALPAEPRSGPQPLADHRRRLGLRLRRHVQHRRPVRDLSTTQDRPPLRTATTSRRCAAWDTASASRGPEMSIRLRLATVFTVATAVIFAFGAWLFVVELSSGLLNLLDSQLKADLVQAGRLVSTPARSGTAGLPLPGQVILQVYDSSGHLRGATPDSGDTLLLTAAQLRQGRTSTLSITTTLENESSASPRSRSGRTRDGWRWPPRRSGR